MIDDITGTSTVALSPSEARAIWIWVLRRQGLAGGAGCTTLSNLVTASLGLHAARLPSPYVTALSRASEPAVASQLLSAEPLKGFRVQRCMRRTLHVLTEELAMVARAATRHYRERDAISRAVRDGLHIDRVNDVRSALLSTMRAGQLYSPKELELHLVHRPDDIAPFRAALKLAWERGELVYHNGSGDWSRERRLFRLSANSTELDDGEARIRLIGAYFDTYGPATIRDAMWWSALPRASIVAALNNDSVVALKTPWCSSPAYIPERRFVDFVKNRGVIGASEGAVDFLAHEDVALKAYFESRSRYCGRVPAHYFYNRIGEVLPTILYEGQVIGRWRWNPTTARVSYRSLCAHPLAAAAMRGPARNLTQHLRANRMA